MDAANRNIINNIIDDIITDIITDIIEGTTRRYDKKVL